MIPLVVDDNVNDDNNSIVNDDNDYDDNNGIGSKKDGFLDEYNEEGSSSSPLHLTSSSSSSSSFFGTRRTPILRFRIGNEYDNFSSSSSTYSDKNKNRTFQIMQITDIHLGEAEFTDWGPAQDEKTMKLLDKMFEYEKPDLIVLGGDQLTANNCRGNCTKYYQILGQFLSNYRIPWATIMGNHDDMDFEVNDGTGTIIPPLLHETCLSLSQNSPDYLTGVTNYVLDVLDPITNQPALQIFFLDSGGGSIREAIENDQVQWLREAVTSGVSTTTSVSTTMAVPSVAFQHIPTSAHKYVDDSCFGYQGEGVAQLEYDGGIVDVMIESDRFHFLAVGHNHGNDYCCPHNQENELYLCFGRHSGYGGYGKWDRGVRMYEFLLTNDSRNDKNDANFK
eukprot:CAMPEP_0171024764 /NCGR_PEP_ID=MMETSP0736-20130129/33168_1 /TAXON_ID=186038 /ORGANISM="Fragilariopsis kerguelensis, Strain L26-C5" /LENGTH=391 /DNA_ID=CAMNT_0011464745 /DNA_START=62 /DNA_END=1233 /DNA_ORIENTATION=-